jgi:hypothetical protein
MRKSWVLWLLAVVLTLASAVYQRLTGPTHPLRGKTKIAGQEISYRLIRTWGGEGGAEVRIPAPLTGMRGEIAWKRYKTRDEFTRAPMRRESNELVGLLPHQPPAGKLLYRILLDTGKGEEVERVWIGGAGVVIRFKGAVPDAVLMVHVAAMFAAMLLATRSGLEVLSPQPRFSGLIAATLACFTVGGMVLGPIVQKYAFGAYWTGWPFGTDLTDNKTAVAWLLWVVAFVISRRGGNVARWVLAAAAATLLIYLIPHSMFGSELKYE